MGGRGDPPEREEQRREHRTALQHRRKVCWISPDFLNFLQFFVLSSQSTLHTRRVVNLEDVLHRTRFASLQVLQCCRDTLQSTRDDLLRLWLEPAFLQSF